MNIIREMERLLSLHERQHPKRHRSKAKAGKAKRRTPPRKANGEFRKRKR